MKETIINLTSKQVHKCIPILRVTRGDFSKIIKKIAKSKIAPKYFKMSKNDLSLLKIC